MRTNQKGRPKKLHVFWDGPSCLSEFKLADGWIHYT